MQFLKSILVFLMLTFQSAYASATLQIDINQGEVAPIPVAIGDFTDVYGAQMGPQIKQIIKNDLQSSGLFKIIDEAAFLESLKIDQAPNFVNWRQIGAVAVASGKVTYINDKIKVEYRLWDPNLENQIEGAAFTLSTRSFYRAAHKIADQIYKRLTGENGYFDSRIVFIAESGPFNKRVKKIAIMDQDGANYKELTDGKDLIITPRFDPTSQRIIYMAYKNKIPQVYILNLQTGEQKIVGNFKGMTFAPRFSPDGRKAIMSAEKNGATGIYEIDLVSGATKMLLHENGIINTSPCYSPDGSMIVFNSDRGGRPQLYVMDVNGGNVRRISFGEGSYNAPVWSPRGDFIAFTTLRMGQFYIGVMRPDGTGERLLTSSWMDEGPSWSPNGRVIIFSRQLKGAGYNLYSIDVTGYNEHKITTPTDASDPAWSPLL